MLKLFVVWGLALGACGGAFQRFPDDVQAAVAHDDMRRLETDQFIIYYPAKRRAEIDRFVARADRCARVLRSAALIHDGPAADKMVIAMPETAFNNAFVSAELLGVEAVSVIPTMSTFDFTTELGLVPDPGFIACHELVHYVHLEQIRGFWKLMDTWFGHLYTPQVYADSWFVEGLATHYEAKLSPGVGRPTWPIFTGIFAAAYAGQHINGGDLSELGRLSPVGHNYLVGTMFVRYLTERYGEQPVWRAINYQAGGVIGWLFPRSFRDGFGVSLADLIDEFDAWHARTFPVRARPAAQRTLATLGNDARYTRGRDGTEAWVAQDVDLPPRLIVRDPDGKTLADLRLLDMLPPRTLVEAEPVLVSGLSITADGREVWLTMIDRATTEHVTRLLRWRRGERSLTELSDSLGPGATIDPTGSTYYYCAVDGDRWSLAAWDVRRGTRRVLVDVAPGTYVLGAQASIDGTRLIASVWDGSAFVAWILDAATGARVSELRGAGTPIWDASFTDENRPMYLGEVDGRFQVFVDGRAISDVPYAALAARSARGTIRFLNRDGWSWTLDEIATPPSVPTELPTSAVVAGDVATVSPADGPPPAADAVPPPPVVATTDPAAAPPVVTADPAAAPPAGPPPALGPPGTAPIVAPPALRAPIVQSDEPYSPWEHFFFPQIRSPSFAVYSTGQAHFGLVLGGGDRLGLQRWSLAGYVQPPDSKVTGSQAHFGGSVAYLNSMLAPFEIAASAQAIDWFDPAETDSDGTVTKASEERQTRDASLSVSRTWRDSLTTAIAMVYTEDAVRPDGGVQDDRKLGGPRMFVSWQAGEATPYTGFHRGLYGSLEATYYPHALSSFAGDIYDTAGALGARIPLPFGRRHALTARVGGRALIAHEDTNLLQLGGFSDLDSDLASSRSTSGDPPTFDDGRFPPKQRFFEFLWGYEDYAISTNRAAIATLWWQYPLILDAGFASTFGFLPPTFFRQLDFKLFATGAIDDRHDRHAAGGLLLVFHLSVLHMPMRLSYQVARRVRDDNAVTQLLGLVFSL
ncbi:MAG: hypothetical protein ABIY55_12250 [Kofleriaceae bacterium]